MGEKEQQRWTIYVCPSSDSPYGCYCNDDEPGHEREVEVIDAQIAERLAEAAASFLERHGAAGVHRLSPSTAAEEVSALAELSRALSDFRQSSQNTTAEPGVDPRVERGET